MAVNIHITIIELNALHTKRQNLFQELDAVIHLLMEAKDCGLRTSRNATSLNSRFKSLDTLKVKIISVTFFFSSRRRHTRSLCDWSSDVCSSDLATMVIGIHQRIRRLAAGFSVSWLVFSRSEERRVGKECRSWWWAHRLRDKEGVEMPQDSIAG